MPLISLKFLVKRWAVWRIVLSFLAGITLSAHANAPLDVRIALVIGNSDYLHVSKLSNPSNDAREMSVALRRLGFDVLEVADGTNEQMARAVALMKSKASGKGAVAMVYFAGHGFQLNWRNYLVPVDAKLSKAADVSSQTLALDDVVTALREMKTRMNILVLDACRDNPFGDQAASVSTGRGLAQLEAPTGTLIAFATAPGNVADDGAAGKNGLYTGFFLKELANPTARIEDVFKRTRLAVRQQSQGKQIPWEATSLEDDFAFHQGVQRAGMLLNPPPMVAASTSPAASAVAVATAPSAVVTAASTSAPAPVVSTVITKPLDAKPLTTAAAAAAVLVVPVAAVAMLPPQLSFDAEKLAWDRIRESRLPQDVYAFLREHPTGFVSELAQARLEQIEPAKAQTQADSTGLIQPSNALRFRVGDEYIFTEKDSQVGRELPRVSYQVVGRRSGLTGDVFTFSNGYEVTQQGAIVKTVGGALVEPAQQWIPSTEYQVGKKWKTRSIMTLPNQGRKIWVEMNGQIVARETITVPAGRFDTYKMEMLQTAEDKSTLKVTYWGQPDWGVAIKQVREVTAPSGAKTSRVMELVERKRGS